MHEASARLERAEEVDGMIGRVAEEQCHRGVAAIARAQVGAGCGLSQSFQFGVADRTVAELDRRPCAIVTRRLRQQVGQRAAGDRIVPVHALGVKLLAGMGHGQPPRCDASAMLNAPLSLAGWGWGWGYLKHRACGLPHSLTLPREGRGNGESAPSVIIM